MSRVSIIDTRPLVEANHGPCHGLIMSIGSRLKSARKKSGLTQKQVRARTGIAQETLSRQETNENDPSTKVAMVLADLYGVTVNWIFTGEESPEVESHIEPVDEHPQERQLREFEDQHSDRFPPYVYRMIRASEYGRHGLTEGQLLDAAKRYQAQEEEALKTIEARLGPPKR